MRPLTFADYIGQDRIKQQLRISIGACQKMNNPLPHMLFSGPPGLGKTTVAKIIANEMGVGFHEIMASNIQNLSDLESVFSNINDKSYDVIFIDEIHRLPMKVEELLYPIMEDFIIEIEAPDDYGNMRPERFWIPKFTLIGATTLAGDLSQPLRDRFGLKFQLQQYQEDEVASIIRNLAKRESIEITKKGLMEIAKRAKGTARIAINYYNRCKEYAYYVGENRINREVASKQFEILGIDELGLDESDYKVLEYLALQTAPVGIDTLAVSTNIDKNTIMSIIEPFLLQSNLMERTRSGRRISPKGLRKIYNTYGETEPEQNLQSNNQPVRRFGERRR